MKKSKQAKLNFTQDMLPKNRVEVFKDVVKNHFSKILWMGLILFIGLLPINLLIINRDLSLLTLFEQYQAGFISDTTFSQERMAMNQTLSLTYIIGLIIFSIVLSGIMRIIRKLSFLEPTALFYDFIKGIKQNFRQYVIVFLVTGLWIAFSYFIYHLSVLNQSVNQHMIYDVLGLLPIAIGLIIFLPIMLFSLVIISVYTNTTFRQFKLGLLTYLHRLLRSLGVVIVIFLPWALYFIQHIILHMILMIVLPFLLPFLILAWFLYTMSILDETINLKHYPNLYQKGLLGLSYDEQKSTK